MMWDYYGAWLWMLPAVGTIALMFWVVRASIPSRAAVDPAVEKLRRRLAAGEISQEEFEKTRADPSGAGRLSPLSGGRILVLNGTSSAGKTPDLGPLVRIRRVKAQLFAEVHRHAIHDIKVDTSALTPDEAAQFVVRALSVNRRPAPFRDLRSKTGV